MTKRVTSGSRWQVPKTEWNLSLVPSQRRHLTLLNRIASNPIISVNRPPLSKAASSCRLRALRPDELRFVWVF
jgi:hypothetical protein